MSIRAREEETEEEANKRYVGFFTHPHCTRKVGAAHLLLTTGPFGLGVSPQSTTEEVGVTSRRRQTPTALFRDLNRCQVLPLDEGPSTQSTLHVVHTLLTPSPTDVGDEDIDVTVSNPTYFVVTVHESQMWSSTVGNTTTLQVIPTYTGLTLYFRRRLEGNRKVVQPPTKSNNLNTVPNV
jgi:hypothetical protein